MAFVTLMMIGVVLAVTLLSCVSDFRSLRIPNLYALIVAGSFVPAFLATPGAFMSPWWHYPLAMVLMFALSYFMFAKGLMGGGDSKLGTALALWVGLRGLLPLVFYMALVGGILGMASLLLQKFKPFKNPRAGGWIAEAQGGSNAIPYGIAISFGSWAAFFHTGLIHHQLDEVFKIMH